MFRFSIDRGGTFTDIYAELPDGSTRVLKLLSEDPAHYTDAPLEGIRRIISETTGTEIAQDQVPVDCIEWIRMGTTVATNALLERKGERTALLITKGFKDVLRIGNQSRPNIFDLKIETLDVTYDDEFIVEIDERVRLLKDFEDESDLATIVTGTTGERLVVEKEPDLVAVRGQLERVAAAGIRSAAVVFLHSYTYAGHEEAVGALATELGFTHVSLSSATMPMTRVVPRGQTAAVDAYLTPCIKRYIETFRSGFVDELRGEESANTHVSFMQSDGGLSSIDRFSGYRAVLSGPAGGVVGYATTTYNEDDKTPVIGFDMGGTSTDVSRFAGSYEHVMETQTAGVTIQAPQLDISTVAAGGGSCLKFESGLFVVGPESAGAHPGPVCYRKGGVLAVTDANLVLGRILPQHFPKIFGESENEPLDYDGALAAFEELTAEINAHRAAAAAAAAGEGDGESGAPLTVHEVALGYVQVANVAMCRPIHSITEARGYAACDHVLACFGGAGGQHACAIARDLGMSKIFIHRYSGILSAYGIGLADVVFETQEPCTHAYGDEGVADYVREHVHALDVTAKAKLAEEGVDEAAVRIEPFLNLRYKGTDTSIMVLSPPDGDYRSAFETQYETEYGFRLPNRTLLIDDIRVRAVGSVPKPTTTTIAAQEGEPVPLETTQTYFSIGGLQETNVYELKELGGGAVVNGPAILLDSTSTIVVEPRCEATVTGSGDVEIVLLDATAPEVGVALDLVYLSVFSHRFMGIAEQMGKTLQRTAISTNIKERLDFSCAIFGPDGGLVANAPHLPVHLGSMQEAVKWQIDFLGADWKEGEVVVSNHPCAGGSHLPDITVITPVFREGVPVFFVASRGHHADIGGISPGSMPPFSSTLEEEGAAIRSFKLVVDGEFQEEGITELLMMGERVERGPRQAPCSGTRNLSDNLSDLRAQVAANNKGIGLINELIAQYGLDVVQAYMGHVQHSAEVAVRDMLTALYEKAGLEARGGPLHAVDYMDDGSPIALSIEINPSDGTAIFDFTGTGPEVHGNCNSPRAVAVSAILYCLRCLIDRDIPLNQGCLVPITINIPDGTLISPSDGAAVVGGNVLTSQRVTDVILEAFGACACSQGCMNNLTFGDESFGYYETIAGGSGAGPDWHGKSGVHTHMTNTRITDVEIFERNYPVLLRRFCLRPYSGGRGEYSGGDGVIREFEFLKDLDVGILSERRALPPRGMNGGEDAKRGVNLLVKGEDGRVVNVGGKSAFEVTKGDRLEIHSPGGGGYGSP